MEGRGGEGGREEGRLTWNIREWHGRAFAR